MHSNNAKTKQKQKVILPLTAKFIPLTHDDKKEKVYVAKILIGTPPKPFQLMVDTGSSETWVFGAPCNFGDWHNFIYRYEARFSDTAILQGPSEVLEYKDGRVFVGNIYSETVDIGGLIIRNQRIVSVSRFISSRLADYYDPIIFDGFIGMSYSSMSLFEVPTIFENLVIRGPVAPIFGVFLARESQGETGSQLTLGGFDQDMAGKPNYNDLISSDLWIIKMDSVNVNGVSILTKSAIIDTGTSLIHGPLDEVRPVFQEFERIGGVLIQDGDKHFVKYPCSLRPIVSFTFQGQPYPISPDDLILVKENDVCGSVILGEHPYPSWEDWILGIAFLKNVYTVFDMSSDRIGFTSLTSTSGERIFPYLRPRLRKNTHDVATSSS